MLSLSAEAGTAKTVRGVRSYCVPHYYHSKTGPLAAARKLSKSCKDITYTQVCRGFKSIAAVKEALAAAAKISSIKTILFVTGDHASKSDISIFDLLRAVDRKRFKKAAAIVFTRKNEAARIVKKIGAGATEFYTQPVFPGNAGALVNVLQKLPHNVRCSVRIGVMIPFSAAACRRIAKEKPGFISGKTLVERLAAAERKSPEAAYAETAKIAKEAMALAGELAEKNPRVTGVHLFGLTGRTFGKGKNMTRVTAGQLLRRILH
ncbi:hypothetical protein HYV83_03370 [Candidatus Woesearchaeota archaeon]|nr:hypothetical protein [Candidatus Woesearchaeota archaeon]